MSFDSKDTCEMRCIVKGLVQGVGFRYSTRSAALALKLKGTVCNLLDGSVKIVAQGEKRDLENLISNLKEEMFPYQITETTIDFFPIAEPFVDFRIIP